MKDTFKIEIPVTVEDKTEPGVSQAKAKITGFDKVVEKAQDRLTKINNSKFKATIETVDKVTGTISTIGTKIKSVTGKAWNFTVGVIDKATAPLQSIFNLLKNPILQAGAVLGISISVKDSLDTFAGFESTMSKVEAISGATAEEMDKLSALAKEMGSTTKFTAEEAAEGLTYMAMAGWKTEDMLTSLSGIMNLAAASGEDLATVSDIVTDAMTAFGLAADGVTESGISNATHFADVLAAASSNANTTVSGMGDTFKYVGSMAGAMGYSIEDVALATGLMANSGIKGTMAGTALNSIFTRLSTNTSHATDTINALGIEFFNSDGSARDLKDVIDELRQATLGMSAAEKSELANTVAGTEAQKGLLAILNTSEEDYQKLAEAIYNADGAAEAMSETMLDNLQGSLTLLQSAVDGVKLALGSRLSPYVRQFADWLTTKMPDVESVINEVMDSVDGKIGELKATIEDFTSSTEWADADIWGKLSIAWNEIIAEPFSEWWETEGKPFFADKAASVGKGLGSGITAGFLALLGIDTTGVVEDGVSIGKSFTEGFLEGFDLSEIGRAITEWAGNNKGIAIAVGAKLGFNAITGLASGINGITSLFSGITGGGTGISGGGTSAASAVTVNGAVVNVYGTIGKASVSPEGTNALPSVGGSSGSKIPALSAGGSGSAPTSSASVVDYTVLGNGKAVAGTGGLVKTGLATVGSSLGSGAATMTGAAVAGGASIAGIIGGIAGLISSGVDIYQGHKAGKAGDSKTAKTEYASAGSKAGMVATGAGIGAAVGSIVPVVGTGVGAAVGAGIGGVAGILTGDSLGQWFSDATDEGGMLNQLGETIGTFFTETVPQKWGEFWDDVGNFFSETVPYAIGYAAGKLTEFFTVTIPEKWTSFWDGVGSFFTESVPVWWEGVKSGAVEFFTVTIPEKWTEFWTGVGDFFTETIPEWWDGVKEGATEFFTVTIPEKWTSFWSGVGDFFTESIPTWIENNVQSAVSFFTETLPAKWSSFWSGVGEKLSGLFGSFFSNAAESYGAGYNAATGHAWGGIMTAPHMGVVAEDGAEAIIPLSPSKSDRGMDLWLKTGQMLGVKPYAEGGIVGDSGDAVAAQTSAADIGNAHTPVEINIEMRPEFRIDGNDMDEESIVAVIKAHIREMADDLSDEMADRLARAFANMPLKGSV